MLLLQSPVGLIDKTFILMNTKRILLIDDEEDIQALARLSLELEAGWEITTASSGEEGLAIAEQQPPDAILLDVMMPNLDGLGTLERLRKDPTLQQVPVIFVTAKAQASDRRRFYAAGVKGVITKPFDPLTLAGQIAGFLAWEYL